MDYGQSGTAISHGKSISVGPGEVRIHTGISLYIWRDKTRTAILTWLTLKTLMECWCKQQKDQTSWFTIRLEETFISWCLLATKTLKRLLKSTTISLEGFISHHFGLWAGISADGVTKTLTCLLQLLTTTKSMICPWIRCGTTWTTWSQRPYLRLTNQNILQVHWRVC